MSDFGISMQEDFEFQLGGKAFVSGGKKMLP